MALLLEQFSLTLITYLQEIWFQNYLKPYQLVQAKLSGCHRSHLIGLPHAHPRGVLAQIKRWSSEKGRCRKRSQK